MPYLLNRQFWKLRSGQAQITDQHRKAPLGDPHLKRNRPLPRRHAWTSATGTGISGERLRASLLNFSSKINRLHRQRLIGDIGDTSGTTWAIRQRKSHRPVPGPSAIPEILSRNDKEPMRDPYVRPPATLVTSLFRLLRMDEALGQINSPLAIES